LCKIVVLLKTIKLINSAPACFNSRRNGHQGDTTITSLKLHVLLNCVCRYRRCQCYGGIWLPDDRSYVNRNMLEGLL